MAVSLTKEQVNLRSEAIEVLRQYQLAEIDYKTPKDIKPFDILYGKLSETNQLNKAKKSAKEERSKVTNPKTKKKAKELAEKNKQKICAALQAIAGATDSLTVIITAIIVALGVVLSPALIVAIALIIFQSGTAFYCAGPTKKLAK
jgi:hypothetical protein